MKSPVAIFILTGLLVPLMCATAAAQQGVPATSSQVHTHQWDWGYVGVNGLFGNFTSNRYSNVNGDYSESILGVNMVLGVGSNESELGTEFNFQMMREVFTIPDDGTGEQEFDQWIAKLGASILWELRSNEAITASGEVMKSGIGVTGVIGGFVLFFPDDEFEPAGLRTGISTPQFITEASSVEDEQFWGELGIMVEVPFGNFAALTAYMTHEFYLYQMERLMDTWPFDRIFLDYDHDAINADYFVGDWQMTVGAMLALTPSFEGSDARWRFFVSFNYIFTTSREGHPIDGAQTDRLVSRELPNMWMANVGIDIGW